MSRGQSRRLLKLFLGISPVIVGSFLVGLPFGIEGVALLGAAVLVGILPWILRYAFQGTDLTLWRFTRAIVWPSVVCLAAVVTAEVALYLSGPQTIYLEGLKATGVFVAVYVVSMLIRPVCEEVKQLRDVLARLTVSFSRTL